MMNQKIYKLLLVSIMLFFSHKSEAQRPNHYKSGGKVNIIFETDIGNDIDDALALDMLYKYLDINRINLLGISINKDNPYSPKFIDIMNTWYGYPHIPIAMVKDGTEDTVPINFASRTYEHTNADGTKFKRQLAADHDFTESTRFYREVLANQKDGSVTIVSVGYLTNLARLLETKGDDISPLTGKQLISQKVKRLSVMGGNFNGINPQEYNIVQDIASAKKVFDEWPTPIIVSPFEVGNQILYPGATIEQNLAYTGTVPLVVAYKSYMDMPYDRPTWDLTSVLEAIEEGSHYFGYSKKGKVTITATGESLFEEGKRGKHRYLTVDEKQSQRIKDRFVELISSTKSQHQNTK